MSRIGVMHVTDTLDAGGAERMAVNIVNLLRRDRYAAHLCTTRREGELASLVTKDVRRLALARKRRFDVAALQRMIAYIRENEIQILHAHGTSLFVAALASVFPPYPAVVWHDHYGRYKFDDRPAWLYRLAAKRISAVIAVNQQLAEWALQRLHLPRQRVRFIPNFVCQTEVALLLPDLPGQRGSRIACVANFRPQKDHLNLVRAMARVVSHEPGAHLLLMGGTGDQAYLKRVREEITKHDLDQHISVLGQRSDVPEILRACDIGVLSSASEGLPLALLEYGMARLPAVATNVGQCPEALNYGRAGLLVAPGDTSELAESLLALMRSPTKRIELADAFYRRVQDVYSPVAVLDQVDHIYHEIVLKS